MKCSVIFIVYLGSMLCHEGSAMLLDVNCIPSKNFRGKIMNGIKTELESTPWMALIRNSSKGFICGGSLIHRKFVMTAAHCIENELYVHLGVYDQYCPPSKCKLIEEYKVIENFTYNINGIQSDIGLLRLDRQVDYKDHIRPICIILDSRVNPFSIRKFSAYGWGKMENGKVSRFLRTITLYRRYAEECDPYLGEMPKGMFCAGTKNGDTCRGDSGGPLNAHVKRKRKWIYAQFGIVSYGSTSCNFNAYYIDVMRYKMWIMEMVTFGKRDYLWNVIKNSANP